MRPIEFRAYNKELKYYYYFTLEDLVYDKVFNLDRSHYYDSKILISCEEPHQFVRLLDKNSTKIFEGDIISYNNRHIPKTSKRVRDVISNGILKRIIYEAKDGYIMSDIRKVEYNDEYASFSPFNEVCDYDGATMYDLYRDIEVIGNIYQSPELLK